MNKVIHFIHPKDESTDFLTETYEYLAKKTNAIINVIRIENKDNHFDLFTTVPNIPNNELICFLGHGTSTGLSGAQTSDYNWVDYIIKEQLKIFENKSIMLLSCRSNQYLKTYFKECNIKTAIGFPNLITDFAEIEHHDDPLRVENITQKDIDIFKEAIVDIVKYSFEDFINNDFNYYQLINRIKLRISKRVINLYYETPNNGMLPLGKMFNDLIHGMILFRS